MRPRARPRVLRILLLQRYAFSDYIHVYLHSMFQLTPPSSPKLPVLKFAT